MLYKKLGKKKVKQIHEDTLQLLSKTGIILEHEEAKEMLQSYGAEPDGDRILIPAKLVEQCLEKCPKTVKLEGRDPKKAVKLGSGKLYTHNVGGVKDVYTPGEGRRLAKRQDVIQATRILDYLPDVSTVTPFYTPQDVNPKSMTLWRYYDTVQNTTKPLRGPAVRNVLELKALAEMAKIVGTEKSLVANVSPVSPLRFPKDVVDVILEAAKQGIPLNSFPCPMMGTTAPITQAGGLLLQNAELLASIVIAYLKHPGLPVVYRGRLSVMNPYNAFSVWGSSDIGIASVGTVELGKHYKLPTNVYGFCTNAHTTDIQSGFERAINALLPVLAGADEISGIGEMDGGNAGSLLQIIIDHEILKYIKQIQKPIKTDKEGMALDLIEKTIRNDESSRNFLSGEALGHTLKHTKQGGIMIPELANRKSHDEWKQANYQGIIENAQEKISEILSTHEVVGLTMEQLREMEKVIKAAEK